MIDVRLEKNKNVKYTLKEDGGFIIKNYNSAYPFSNFLPGVADVYGVPLWVFYVSRAQGIISFGIQDKDHSILEFFPANKAYASVPFIGFRTFIKINRKIHYEPFKPLSKYEKDEEMLIRSSSFKIYVKNYHFGLEIVIKYFTLPNTPLGALVRVLSIRNISSKTVDLEVLDGLPRIIPFGTGNVFLKDLAKTVEAWMHSSIFDNLALFKLIVDPKDISQTKYLEGANFNYSFFEENNKKIFPKIIIDPEIVFSKDISFTSPLNFLEKEFIIPKKEIVIGKTPSALSYFMWHLKPNEEKVFYNIFGSSFKAILIRNFIPNINSNFLKKKEIENDNLIEKIKKNAFCVSSISTFNNYVSGSYLDNILRGGYPYKFDTKKIYYVFSRKHGDLERDYNKFKLLPSYFSEGEGNYRDINQNRRIDLFFNPFLYKKNIVYFLNFIKIDGYNPLVIKGEKLFLSKKQSRYILKTFKIENDENLINLMVSGFYLGDFFKFLKEKEITIDKINDLVALLLQLSKREPQAVFGDGYWIDHWHYNLDLIENFLYFYPDKTKDLALSKEYCFWDDEHRVKERHRRYVLKNNKIFQYNSVEIVEEKKLLINKRLRYKNFLRTKKGFIYKTNLIVKLLSLILNKCSTLDPDGIGVEMEADKPGWCDSLNGLPAIFGSSLSETLQIKRACLLLIDLIEKLKNGGVHSIIIPKELLHFLNCIKNLLKSYLSSDDKKRDFLWWDKANCIKEQFRKKTFFCIDGEEKKVSIFMIENFLKLLIEKLNIGIKKAKDKKSGLYYTYFIREVKKYTITRKGIKPLQFKSRPLTFFLEALVDILKVEKQKSTYFSVKKSELFDKELKMYRLNANLKKEPLEIGRSRIFPAGWLENESIWLHMEYKYLLEVLKNGLYNDFYNDFYNCGVCFLSPENYGRSPMENSSFIVSSAHLDKNLWGKGFVCRLSGATVELLNIWMIFCLGLKPFFVNEKKEFCIKFSPILKGEFFTKDKKTIEWKDKKVILEKNTFTFSLFSSILVTYHNPERIDTFSTFCKIEKIILKKNNDIRIINSSIILPPLSLKIRDTEIDFIDVYFGYKK